MVDFNRMSRERGRIRALTATERLAEIKTIIEMADNRAMACDGPVSRTADELSTAEWITIYKLCGGFGCDLPEEEDFITWWEAQNKDFWGNPREAARAAWKAQTSSTMGSTKSKARWSNSGRA